jgi:ribosomal-protein-serine acetyltransferase
MQFRTLVVDDHIQLKEIDLKYAELIFNIIDSEREYLREWLPFVDISHDVSHTRSFIENYLNSDRLDLTSVIFYDDLLVGIIALKETDVDNKKTEIGYWISQHYQHKGIVSNACRKLIEYAFEELYMNRIQIKTATGNIKSQHIAKRLDFKLEGKERDGELHTRGFVDLNIYSLLKRDRPFNDYSFI